MTQTALLGNELKFQYMNTAVSPNAWTTINAAVDFGELGEEKPLVDITALTSTAREYRNGLADGVEIPLVMNFNATDSQWTTLYTSYGANTLLSYRVLIDSVSPNWKFSFSATVRAWKFTGKPGEKSSATFTLKISGAVTKTP